MLCEEGWKDHVSVCVDLIDVRLLPRLHEHGAAARRAELQSTDPKSGIHLNKTA